MTVRILDFMAKDHIAYLYKEKVATQKELAERYGVSQRTINRVLIEKGLATPVARVKGEAYQVMQLLKKHHYDYQSLKNLLEGRNYV